MFARHCLYGIFFLLPALLQGSMVHVLNRNDMDRAMGRSLELLSIPHGTLTPTQALDANGYAPISEDVPNLHITGSDHWLRVRIGNDTGSDKVVVSIPYWEIDELDAYIWNGEVLEQVAHFGQSVSEEERIGQYPEMAFDIDLPTIGSTTLLIRVHSVKQVQFPLTFTTREKLLAERGERNLLSGAYMGLMIFLVLYNFFLFLSMRDRGYLHYVLYILTLCLAQLTLHGVGQTHLWSDMPWLASNASVLFTLSSMLFAGYFTRRFLGLRSMLPRMDRILVAVMILIGIALIIYLLGWRSLGYKMAQGLSGSYSLLLITIATMAQRAGSRAARFFLGAWMFFLASVVVYIFRDLGILPWNDLTTYSIPLGSAIEGVLLSFGLADRINILRREKERSQAETLTALQENGRLVREQNVVLEHKVKERTHALQESNDTLKRTQTQLVNAEKMASLGQLTAGIAHEINNPINFITSNVQPLRRNIREIVEVMAAYRAIGPADADRQLEAVRSKERAMDLEESIAELDDIIDSIAEGSSRTAEIVRGLRNFSRLDEDDLKEADLNEGLRSTLAVLAPQFRDKVSIELDLGAIPPVECFPGKVNQVFMNVITNAVQATLQRLGDRPRVVHVSSFQQDDHVLIRISDNGVGMTDDVKVRIYDPFFTTKPVGEGTGLGMAIVYGIIQDHRGDIHVESSPGVGTEFTIDLPVRHQRATQQRA
jgi:hypothetical protein